MFMKGDMLKVGNLSLTFAQDTKQLGNTERGKYIYGGIADGPDHKRYYVKYAGDFENDPDGIEKLEKRWEMIDVQGGKPQDFLSPFLAGTVAFDKEASCKEKPIHAVAMEYAEGISLGNRIRQINSLENPGEQSRKNMTSRERTDRVREAYRLRFDLIRQLLLGIRDYSKWEEGIYVHQDLKPDNIRVQVREEGDHIRQYLRILDFDFLLGPDDMPLESQDDKPFKSGTAGYTHPDLYFGTGIGYTDPHKRFSWDLYSAGMLIYYIMEGKEHFSEEEFSKEEYKRGEKLFELKPMRFERIQPLFGELVRSMVSRDQVEYYDIDSVIGAFQRFWHGFYGERFASALRLPQYLECFPAEEESVKQRSLFCEICEKDAEGKTIGSSCYRSFTLYAGRLLRLTYGKGGNICGAWSPEDPQEIGVISYIPGDTAKPLEFIPYSDAARRVEQDGKLAGIIFEDRDEDGHVHGTLELVISEI